MVGCDQMSLEFYIVFNDTVVDYDQLFFAVGVRMGIGLTWCSVGGPTGVGGPNVTLKGFKIVFGIHFLDFALIFQDKEVGA